MTYSIRIFTIDSQLIDPFVVAFDLYRDLVTQLQGHVSTDILRRNNSPQEFILFDFWTGTEAYNAALHAPQGAVLSRFLLNLALKCDDLGQFEFLPSRNLGIAPVANETSN